MIDPDEFPGVDIAAELKKFGHWTQAHGKRYDDWEAGFRMWLARAWRTPTAEVVEITTAPRARPDCDWCAGSGWMLPDGADEVERCGCLLVAEVSLQLDAIVQETMAEADKQLREFHEGIS